ncbi:hypothetical protein BDW59DRAFT_151864, partial [Aspergillus cavernicola]
MGDLLDVIRRPRLTAGSDIGVLWSTNRSNLKRTEREKTEERALATSRYLVDCDLVIFCDHCYFLLGFRERFDRPQSGTEIWLHYDLHAEVIRSCYQQSVFD